MRTLGRNEQQALDHYASEWLGLPTLLLMEQAASAVSREVLSSLHGEQRRSGRGEHLRNGRGERPRNGRSVTVLCGRGSNGGDGYAAARLLLGRVSELRVFEPTDQADKLAGDAAVNRTILLNLGVKPRPFAEFKALERPAGELIVDAVFGSGFSLEREQDPEYIAVLEEAGRARRVFSAFVLAVDLPSGVEAASGRALEEALEADVTLSFVYPKTGIVTYPGRKYAGRIVTADLGLPADFIDRVFRERRLQPPMQTDLAEIRSRASRRAADSHKGSNGRTVIMAGSPGMGGAAVLAGRAAIRSGAGLVRLAVPPGLYGDILGAVPSALITALPGEDGPESAGGQPGPAKGLAVRQLEWWKQQMEGQDAAAMGPGLGRADRERPGLHELVLEAVLSAPRLVLDADALNLLAEPQLLDWGRAALGMRAARGLEPAVLTPHPGEARRLLPEDPDLVMRDRIQACRRIAELTGSAVVLKGAGTVTAIPWQEGLKTWINTSGNAGMGKGGSGDILSGILASFLGQGIALETAVIAAVYLHGLAGDLAAEDKTERALAPEDLLEYLPEAMRMAGWL